MKSKIVIVLIVLLIIIPKLTKTCSFIKNVKLTVHPENSSSYPTTVNGCIERTSFEKRITEIYIKNEKIDTLGHDAVRHLLGLNTFSVKNCGIKDVLAGAFRNVPHLKTVQIIYNELDTIHNEAFDIESMEMLRINHNKIKTIEDSALGYLPNLRRLNISHNLLTNWKSEWFTNSTNIKIIDLSFNKIAKIPRNAFTKLRKLSEIHLEFNEILTIDKDAFKGLKKMDLVGLSFNKLSVLDVRIFPQNGLFVQTFLLDANRFNYLGRSLMDRIRVGKLMLNGNPWKCQCLDEVFDWLFKTNGSTRMSGVCSQENIPVCWFPTTSSHGCVETVDRNITDMYFNKVRQADPPLPKHCVRLD